MRARTICPHCGQDLLTSSALGAHLRDDGDAGTRCPRLRIPRTWPAPDPDSALSFDEVEAAGLDGTLRNMV